MARRGGGTRSPAHMCRYTLQGVRDGHRLITRRLFVRRARELNSLSGWQTRMSTAMEIGDVVAPLLSRLFARVSRFVSWLLVSLVGRGLGLIYKGVRESLRGGGSGAGRDGGDGGGGRRAGRRGGEEGDVPDGFFYGFA